MKEAYANRANKKYKHFTFKEGDEVLLYNVRKRSRKGARMERDYSGPYTIQQLLGKTAMLTTMTGKHLKTKHSITHLKPYKRGNVGHKEAGPDEPPTKIQKLESSENQERESVIKYVGKTHLVGKTQNQHSDKVIPPFSKLSPSPPPKTSPSPPLSMSPSPPHRMSPSHPHIISPSPPPETSPSPPSNMSPSFSPWRVPSPPPKTSPSPPLSMSPSPHSKTTPSPPLCTSPSPRPKTPPSLPFKTSPSPPPMMSQKTLQRQGAVVPQTKKSFWPCWPLVQTGWSVICMFVHCMFVYCLLLLTNSLCS
nr:uncharacterized protein LOC129163455 isoform X1 [Nothobranchius furzeri]XP_054597109.1 uncharacterized protein LOC129163455 isoform X1 [Nothobranchius furzeri]